MSIILSREAGSAVIIHTDGAVYDRNQTLTQVRRKILTSNKVPVAVATRGDKTMGSMVRKFVIGMVEDFGFDRALLAIEHVMPEFALLPDGGNEFEALVAGVSETRGPRHMLFQNTRNFGLQPLALIHPGPFFIGASAGGRWASIRDSVMREQRPDETAADYYVEGGLRTMQLFRECPVPPQFGERVQSEAYFVGGQCDVTMVTPDEVWTQTLHRWDDRIGERIDPFADRRTVVPLPTGMNRHERRAAAARTGCKRAAR